LEIIFVLGGPGAGKGTQCALLAKKYGMNHSSLGDILRQEAANPDSKWGEVISRNMQEGLLGSKEMTVEHLNNAVEEFPEPFDGNSNIQYVLVDCKLSASTLPREVFLTLRQVSPEAWIERFSSKNSAHFRCV
jgi:adenylate kinase family enzyme